MIKEGAGFGFGSGLGSGIAQRLMTGIFGAPEIKIQSNPNPNPNPNRSITAFEQCVTEHREDPIGHCAHLATKQTQDE